MRGEIFEHITEYGAYAKAHSKMDSGILEELKVASS